MCNWQNAKESLPLKDVDVLLWDVKWAYFISARYNGHVWEFDDGAPMYPDDFDCWWTYIEPPAALKG